MTDPPRSILIVCLRLIGDVILATPLIGVFREAYPGADIDVLVNRGTGEFLEKDRRVRRVLVSRGGDARKDEGGHAGGYIRRILRRYDVAVNLNASDRGNIAAAAAGRTVRLGFRAGPRSALADGWKRLFLTHVVEFPYAIHVARVGQLAAEALGIPVRRLEAKVFWDAADEARVEDVLRGKGVVPPFLVIHPFARWRYKYWKAERFAEVSDAVARRYGLAPVWTSSPDPAEARLLAEAASLCSRPPAALAGELTLNQMTCLLAKASLYVGLDTAVSHLAATTGIPMVVLFGPTIAERWSPWNNDGPVAQQCPLPRGTQRTGNIVLVQEDRDCVPCGRKGCDDRGEESPCMAGIRVADVLGAVDALLGGAPPRGRR